MLCCRADKHARKEEERRQSKILLEEQRLLEREKKIREEAIVKAHKMWALVRKHYAPGTAKSLLIRQATQNKGLKKS